MNHCNCPQCATDGCPAGLEMERAENRIAELEKILALEKADTARMNWYEQANRDGIRPGLVFDSEEGFKGWEWEGHKNPLFPTLRAAIDAAMLSK